MYEYVSAVYIKDVLNTVFVSSFLIFISKRSLLSIHNMLKYGKIFLKRCIMYCMYEGNF